MNQKTKHSADYIIIGLGLAGLSIAYQLAKSKKNVIAFQQFSHSGAFGTSSGGQTRIFRYATLDSQLSSQIKYDYQKWRQIQKLTNQKIIHISGGLLLGYKKHPMMTIIRENQKDSIDQELSSQQIMKRFPAIKVKQQQIGFYSHSKMGYFDVKSALSSLKMLAEREGAKLCYNTQLIAVNEQAKRIELKGLNQQSNQFATYKECLIMSTGPYSMKFSKEKNLEKLETQSIAISDPSGMPPVTLYFGDDVFYSLPNDPQRKEMKVGIHERRNFTKLLSIVEEYFPSKLDKLRETSLCFYTMRYSDDEGFHIYKQNNTIWCYGFNGVGFKHGPSIAQKVRALIGEGKLKPAI